MGTGHIPLAPCWQPWHGGNNPNIYSSASCQGQQFFKLLIRFLLRLTSASQILAIVIFYCQLLQEWSLSPRHPGVGGETMLGSKGGWAEMGPGWEFSSHRAGKRLWSIPQSQFSLHSSRGALPFSDTSSLLSV